MNRVCLKKIILVSFLCFCCFSCSFNLDSVRGGEISFTLPETGCNSDSNKVIDGVGSGVVSEFPKSYDIKIVYDDGSVVYSKNHKARDLVSVQELETGQYTISIRGETADYIFIGESVANVLKEEVCDVDIKIERWKKGMIKLDLSKLDVSIKELTDAGNTVPEFTVSIFNSSDKKVYSCPFDYNTLDSEKKYLINHTLPVGAYTVKLTGGNPDWAYRVNKDLKIDVSDGKVFVCGVQDHQSINYFISSNGSDENGTGEQARPFRTLAHVANLIKDVNVTVKITIADNVVENGAVTFSNPRGRVFIEGLPNSSISAKGGINAKSGTIILENGTLIKGSNKITVGSGCTFVMKDSAMVFDDTVVSLQQGACLRLNGNLTNNPAAHIEMFTPKNKTFVLGEFIGMGQLPIPDLLKNNCGKIKFIDSQKYEIKEDGKAWAQIPTGYMGIDDALAALSAGSGISNPLKVFVDDYAELKSLANGVKNTSAASVALDFKTNPQVSSINDTYFKGNGKLSSIVIPSTIKTIGDNCFSGCTGLSTVKFDDGVKTVGSCAFSGCSSLARVNFSDSITSIGTSSFNGCTKLTNITFGKGLETIGNSAFVGSGLNGTITLPQSLKTIGNDAFSGCGITNIVFNEGLTSIGVSAFKDTAKLVNVISFPASLKSIGNTAFYGSAITGVVFKEGLTSIGVSAFNGASSLTGKIDMPSTLRTIGNNAFDGCNLIVGLKLNNGLTSIGTAAFKNCSGITGEVTIPGTVKSAFGKEAFSGCTQLTKAIIENGVTIVSDNAFSHSGITSVEFGSNVGRIGTSAFENTKLTSISIPGSVRNIGTNAFLRSTSLASVILNEGLETISKDAFSTCSALNSIKIPVSVISISSGAFSSSGLTNVTFSDLKSKWDKSSGGIFEPGKSSGQIAVGDVNGGCSRPLRVEEAVAKIKYNRGNLALVVGIGNREEMYTLRDAIYDMPGGTITIDLRTPMTTLPDNAFANCSKMTKVTIHSGITSIGMTAFANCSNLATVILPSDSITTIDNSAFASCIKLNNFTIPATVTKIGAKAFDYCKALTTVTFAGSPSWTVTKVGSSSSQTYNTGTDDAKALTTTYLDYKWSKN